MAKVLDLESSQKRVSLENRGRREQRALPQIGELVSLAQVYEQIGCDWKQPEQRRSEHGCSAPDQPAID
jgi:hypothetical protein